MPEFLVDIVLEMIERRAFDGSTQMVEHRLRGAEHSPIAPST